MPKSYECIIIGGGLAGLQAAIQLGRYKHHILVIDSNDGRSTICKNYRNILGWPDGISGEALRYAGRKQATSYGVTFVEDKVTRVTQDALSYVVMTEAGKTYTTKTILFATGVSDRIPDIPHLKPCLGASVYICPDCDGYEVKEKIVLVLGSGEAGAKLALALTYWTKQITYINHDDAPINDSLRIKLHGAHIAYRNERILEVITENEEIFQGVKLQGGKVLYAERAFIGFGGNQVHTNLAAQLGVAVMENKHIIVDPRTKETNVTNIWAAGDIVAHSEQAVIAMGEGSQAAIWIHKRLMK
ncbi:NAD(P)/FAD-dependent oxidoreductase [Microbacteriaceae bacterium 4G12]